MSVKSFTLTRDMNIELLKTVLAVPTKSRMETKMIVWLLDYFRGKGIPAYCDPIGNVYATKGELGEGEFYPCVIAHTDTVHQPEAVTIVQEEDRLIALDEDCHQTGLGGDDKSGIFICLELFELFDKIKGAFFVSEEIGCLGSRECDRSFFDDVGYAMQFDSPCDDIITYTCDGTQLFPDKGDFSDILLPVLEEFGVTNWQHHPFTDASIIKRYFNFPCLNLPAGYFRMHSANEYVSMQAVRNSIKLGAKLLKNFGPNKYFYYADDMPGTPAKKVTMLKTHG